MEPDDAKSMKEEKTDNAIATIDDDVSGGVPVKVEKKMKYYDTFQKDATALIVSQMTSICLK